MQEARMNTIWYKLWNAPSLKYLIKLLWSFVNWPLIIKENRKALIQLGKLFTSRCH